MLGDLAKNGGHPERTVKEYAEIALQKTRDAFCLGSWNISSVYYDPSMDRPLLVTGLFAGNYSKRRVQLDALIDSKVTDVANDLWAEQEIMANAELIAATSNGKPLTYEEDLYFYMRHREEAQVAQCSTLATYALIKLISLGYQGSAEYIYFQRLDHGFLVLNRPEKSSSDNWKTWGKETIILDPWINEVFSADQLGKIWKEYIRIPGVRMYVDYLMGNSGDRLATTVATDIEAFRGLLAEPERLRALTYLVNG